MLNKVILAGGSGQIGTALAEFYKDKARNVIILSRGKEWSKGNVQSCRWDGKTLGDWKKHIDGADLVVNLAGKNVNCRYTEENVKEIFDSRKDSVEVLGNAIAEAKVPPKVWIQSASATIYRHAEDRPMDEANGEIGQGFSVDVCKLWENTFWAQNTPATRKIALRIGIVMGREEGAFPRLLNLVKYGLGGQQGNGRQYVSWIHEADVVGVIDFLFTHEELQGTFNCTSPNPVTNAEMMRIIRKENGTAFGLPAPAWLLAIGAVLIGTETELILKSRWVLPDKLMKVGYKFRYPKMDEAVRDILHKGK